MSASNEHAMPGMKELFENPVYSDLTIVYGGQEFKVHKAILHSQSAYFRKVLDLNCQAHNSTFGRLDLGGNERPAAAFEVLLRYLYERKYDEGSHVKEIAAAPLSVWAYAVANEYECPSLCQLATERLRRTIHMSPIDPFLETLQLIESYATEASLWDIVVSVAKSNIKYLLGLEEFRKALKKHDQLNFRLLAQLDPTSNGVLPQLECGREEHEAAMLGSIEELKPDRAKPVSDPYEGGKITEANHQLYLD